MRKEQDLTDRTLLGYSTRLGSSGEKHRSRVLSYTLLAWLFPLLLLATEPGPGDAKTGTTSSRRQTPPEADLADLATGERVEGVVLTESFQLRTAYGDIHLKRHDMARIDCPGPDRQLQRVTTANSNILSGFLTNATIDFETSDGIRKNFRPQKLLYIRLGSYRE